MIGYQNCGQLDPKHTSSSGSLGEFIPTGDGNVDTSAEDALIASLEPAAISSWGRNCNGCHQARTGNGQTPSITVYREQIYNGDFSDFAVVNNFRIQFRNNRNNRTHTMPTNVSIPEADAKAFADWAAALMAKKAKIESDVEACYQRTPYTFTADINPILSQNNIDYQGSARNCLNCHGANSNNVDLSGTVAVRYEKISALALPRRPDASILHDALSPGDGSSPADYHRAPQESIDKIKSWIEGCMPQ
jgi:hypothetical protein